MRSGGLKAALVARRFERGVQISANAVKSSGNA